MKIMRVKAPKSRGLGWKQASVGSFRSHIREASARVKKFTGRIK